MKNHYFTLVFVLAFFSTLVHAQDQKLKPLSVYFGGGYQNFSYLSNHINGAITNAGITYSPSKWFFFDLSYVFAAGQSDVDPNYDPEYLNGSHDYNPYNYYSSRKYSGLAGYAIFTPLHLKRHYLGVGVGYTYFSVDKFDVYKRVFDEVLYLEDNYSQTKTDDISAIITYTFHYSDAVYFNLKTTALEHDLFYANVILGAGFKF